MPISNAEWDAGSTDPAASEDETVPVGEYETEKDLIVAFLSENADNAYTRGEVVKGVDFGNDARPTTVSEAVTEIQDELVDLAGDVVASGLVIGDVDEALDELVEAGTVVERAVETADGTKTYYRLATGEA